MKKKPFRSRQSLLKPTNPDIILDTDKASVKETVDYIFRKLNFDLN